MFRDEYKEQINKIKPSEELLELAMQMAKEHENRQERNDKGQLQNDKRQRVKRRVAWRKPVVAVAVVSLCISLGLPVLASSSDTFYDLLYTISPAKAQFFMPVKKSDESNGIKMEVQSAYIHDNTAEIYITMQDMTGNRIDGTTDLFDSYSINRPFDSMAHCEFVGYDEETKKAAFLIVVEEWGGKDISGDKMTFSVREFLSHKQKFEDINVPVALSEIEAAKNTQMMDLIGAGGEHEKYFDFFDDEGVEALVQGEPMKEFPVEGIGLTGVGYIDGKLHLQTELKDRGKNDNHGYFYFKDEVGNEIKSIYNFYFRVEDENGESIDYCEEVFDIPMNQISKYFLYGNFVTSHMKTEGNWKVTFPLEKAK